MGFMEPRAERDSKSFFLRFRTSARFDDCRDYHENLPPHRVINSTDAATAEPLHPRRGGYNSCGQRGPPYILGSRD